MMDFTIKSKVYIAPKKNRFFLLVLLNICIVIVAILSLLSILGDGVKVGNVSPIIIGLFVVFRSRMWINTTPYYEFSIAHARFDSNLFIEYETGQKVTLLIESIASLEYSDQLECLRIVADFDREINNKTTKHLQEDFLFYVVATENPDFFAELERRAEKKIIYMDRNKADNS